MVPVLMGPTDFMQNQSLTVTSPWVAHAGGKGKIRTRAPTCAARVKGSPPPFRHWHGDFDRACA